MSIEAIGILGAGKNGTLLAQTLLLKGFQIRIYDDFKDRLTACMARLEWSMDKIGKRDLTANIEPVQDLSAFKGADLIIESIKREMDERKIYFRRLKSHLGGDCVVGLNAGVDLVGESVSLLDLPAERSLGLNFVRMAGESRVVEIVKTDGTKDACADSVADFLGRIGKKSVVLRDNPGAIAERLIRPFLLAAFGVLSVGKGYPREIDTAFKSVAGARMGPFELADSVGLGKDYANSLKIYDLLKQPERLKPSQIESKLVQYGQLGKPSGTGVYLYEDGEIVGENPMLSNLIKYLGLRKVSEKEMFSDIFRPVMEEAKILASEIMVSENDIETVGKLGFGWSRGIFNLYRENRELLQPKKKSEFENLDTF